MARYRVGLETRDRILSATRELLSELGIDGVTLKAITDRAGVGAGSFYNLFDSKEEAVLEVVREAIQAVDPDPTGSGTDELDDLVEAYVRFITDEPTIARIYVQLAVTGGLTDERIGARVIRSHRARVDRFADAIRRRTRGGDARERAERLLAALTGLAVTWLLEPELDFRSHAYALCREIGDVAAVNG